MLCVCKITGSDWYGIFDTSTERFLEIGGEMAWSSPKDIDTSGMDLPRATALIERVARLWPGEQAGTMAAMAVSEERQSGRTTAMILWALANALSGLGNRVEIKDHQPLTRESARQLGARAHILAKRLGLAFKFQIHGARVFVVSTYGRSPAAPPQSAQARRNLDAAVSGIPSGMKIPLGLVQEFAEGSLNLATVYEWLRIGLCQSCASVVDPSIDGRCPNGECAVATLEGDSLKQFFDGLLRYMKTVQDQQEDENDPLM